MKQITLITINMTLIYKTFKTQKAELLIIEICDLKTN